LRELVEFLVEALVTDPEAVEVTEVKEGGDLIYEVSVAADDVGRVIGRGGKIANALRTVIRSAAPPGEGRVLVEILD
jgi:predicted RNA-binding protein YlqC (UPF0109 family)